MNWYKKAIEEQLGDISQYYVVPEEDVDKDPNRWDYSEDATYEYYEENNALYEQSIEFNNSKPGDKQPWRVIPLARIKKIWADFARMGFVRDERGINMMQDIVVDNIKKIEANTYLMGHTPQRVEDLLEDEELTLNETDNWDYGDWITDENGNWRISDYSTVKLISLAMELISAQTPEKKLIKLDQIFNVVHQRSDIAGWFVEGGSNGLDEIFNQKI